MLDASIKIYRRNFLTLAKAVLVVAIPGGLLVALIQQSVPANTTTINTNGQFAQTTNFDPQATIGAAAVIVVATLVISSMASAICFKVVGDSYLGHPTTAGSALRFALHRFGSVLWLSFIALMAYVAIWVLPVLVFLALALTHVTVGAVLAGILLFGGALVTTVWFWVSAQVAIPSLMLEGYRGTKAIRRALGLVRGNWWRSFGALFLMTLLTSVVSGIFVAVFAAVTASLKNNAAASVAFNFVIRTITYIAITPVVGSLLVVLSVDLRVRKEGYDIQLLATQMGSTPSPDALSFMPPAPWFGQTGYPPTGYGQGGYPPYQPPHAYPPPSHPPYPASPQYPALPAYPPPSYPPSYRPSVPPPPPPPPPQTPPQTPPPPPPSGEPAPNAPPPSPSFPGSPDPEDDR
jgi:hypothetical protein